MAHTLSEIRGYFPDPICKEIWLCSDVIDVVLNIILLNLDRSVGRGEYLGNSGAPLCGLIDTVDEIAHLFANLSSSNDLALVPEWGDKPCLRFVLRLNKNRGGRCGYLMLTKCRR